jgi:hypothetical protein
MELSEEFILELTQSQQRLFGFLFKRLADREQAREVLQRTNLVLCRKSSAFEPGTDFRDWAMNPQNKTPNTPPMPSFYFAGQKNLMIIARQILGNLLTQLPSPLKYLIQRAGGNAVSLGHRLFY